MKIYGSLILLLALIAFSFTTERSNRSEAGSQKPEVRGRKSAFAKASADKIGNPKNERPIDHSPLAIHQIITGADQTEKYLPLLKNKRVGILANPTTVIGKKHLVDSLMNRGIKFVKAFG